MSSLQVVYSYLGMKHQRKNFYQAQSAQEMQDDIFRRMPAERKIELAADFWRLAGAIARQRSISYDRERPTDTPRHGGEGAE